MGTSSIFDGPVKSLLPSDYDDLDEGDFPEDLEPTDGLDEDGLKGVPYRWKDAKTAMTRYINGGHSNKSKIMSRYVGASGGTRQLSSSSISGKSSAVNLGRVIQGFRKNGVINTLQSLQIEYIGKNVKEVLSGLVNVISGNSESKEDIVARSASSEAISELYGIIVENDDDIESLQRIDENIFGKIIEVFMSEYIFGRVMTDLQSRFEQYENNPKEAVKKERELKDYIKAKVELRLKEVKPESQDYHSSNISEEIDNLFKTCFSAFEEYI